MCTYFFDTTHKHTFPRLQFPGVLSFAFDYFQNSSIHLQHLRSVYDLKTSSSARNNQNPLSLAGTVSRGKTAMFDDGNTVPSTTPVQGLHTNTHAHTHVPRGTVRAVVATQTTTTPIPTPSGSVFLLCSGSSRDQLTFSDSF